ncbi:hypothetical protein ECARS42123_1877, partial [Escherichia coli ARS4.2123]
WQMVIL